MSTFAPKLDSNTRIPTSTQRLDGILGTGYTINMQDVKNETKTIPSTTRNNPQLPITDEFGQIVLADWRRKLTEAEDKVVKAGTGPNPRKWKKYYTKNAQTLREELTLLEKSVVEFHEARSRGGYTWTDEDIAQINALAARLLENKVATWTGRTAIQESEKQLTDDHRCIVDWLRPFGGQTSISPYGEKVIMELTRRIAGRKEAHKKLAAAQSDATPGEDVRLAPC